MVAGFYTVEASYFSDRKDGHDAIDTIFGGINEKYTRYEPDLPLGPEWQVRRRMMVEEARVASLQRFIREEGAVAERVLDRFKVPQIGR